MKKVMRHGFGVLLAGLALAAGALPAAAAEVLIQNQLDGTVDMALHYFDAARGVWATRGWYSVGGHDEREIVLKDVSPKHSVYYYASYGGESCMDQAHAGRKFYTKWVTNKAFLFHNDNSQGAPGNRSRKPFVKVDYSEGFGGYVITLNNVPVG